MKGRKAMNGVSTTSKRFTIRQCMPISLNRRKLRLRLLTIECMGIRKPSSQRRETFMRP